MNKHITQVSLLLCAVVLLFTNLSYVNAAGMIYNNNSFVNPSKKTSKMPTKSFGGKVTLAPIPPPVICNSPGTLMILSSNLKAAMSTINSMTNSGDPEKAQNIAKGLLGLLPTFSTSMTKVPITGGQILGRQNLIPNFTKCALYIGPIRVPIPVYVTTGNYNVSK